MAVRIRTSAGGCDTLMNGVVVGHLDHEGWWPSVFVKDRFFKFTAEDLHSISQSILAQQALRVSGWKPEPAPSRRKIAALGPERPQCSRHAWCVLTPGHDDHCHC